MTDDDKSKLAQAIEGFEQIWTCKIGGKVTGLPKGCDGPMRRAVQECFSRLSGYEADFCFSGWSGSLTEGERAVVEKRPPALERCTVELPIPATGFKWALVIDHDETPN